MESEYGSPSCIIIQVHFGRTEICPERGGQTGYGMEVYICRYFAEKVYLVG